MTNKLSTVPLVVVIAGVLVVVTVGLVTYAPALSTGFRLVDDHTYLHWAGSMSLPQYLADSLDPRLQSFNYRPLRRILILIEYYLFRSEPTGYHLVQVLLHLANALLVLGVVWRLTKRWRLGLLGAVLYAGVPIASEAVLWISDESALATFFSLAAVLFWVNYLLRKDRPDYFLAIGALVLAFLTRESSAVMPIVLFLIDRMIAQGRASILELILRYLAVAIVLIGYLAIEYIVQLHGVFVSAGGYSWGEHVLSNYASFANMLVFPWGLGWAGDTVPPMKYAVFAKMLVFPWGLEASLGDVMLLAIGMAFVGVIVLRRSAVLTFLVLVVFLALGPVVLNPLGAYPRYLYSAALAWAILWALVFEWAWLRWRSQWLKGIISVAVIGLVILDGWSTADTAAEFSVTVRQQRVPFRDIMRQHQTFPNDTRLFLIESPYNVWISEIAGMFFLRYGTDVSVGGTYEDGRIYTGGRLKSEKARLRDYTTAYVYYFDETNRPIEVAVDREAKNQAAPELPSDFAVPIRLEGYEITSSKLNRDQALVLILYWRATGRIEKNYTVFVHLVNSRGEIVVGDDSMPRSGKERTSLWRMDQFTADAHIIPIPQDVAVGNNYRLEVGLYYLPTLERISIVDSHGLAITDTVAIEPFEVVE